MEGQAFTSPSPAADNDHSGLLGNTSSCNQSGSLQDTDSHFIPTYECCVISVRKRKNRRSSPKGNMIHKFLNEQNKVTI